MTNYTPGPWQVDADTALDGTPWIRIYQRTPDGLHITICTMGCSDGEVWGGYVGEERDARIISAAPQLLAAAKASLGKIAHEEWCIIGPDCDICNCFVGQLRAAVRKAEDQE